MGGKWGRNQGRENGWILSRGIWFQPRVWGRDARAGISGGLSWRVSEGSDCVTRILWPAPCWLASRSVLVGTPVNMGLWSAGLGIINPVRSQAGGGPRCSLAAPSWPDVPSPSCPGLECDSCWRPCVVPHLGAPAPRVYSLLGGAAGALLHRLFLCPLVCPCSALWSCLGPCLSLWAA